MDIEKRLREDAARVREVKPPEELSHRLRARLESAGAGGGARRLWLKPALALLTAAMLAVAFLPADRFTAPMAANPEHFSNEEDKPPVSLSHSEDPLPSADEGQEGVRHIEAEDTRSKGVETDTYNQPEDHAVPPAPRTEPAKPAMPWLQVGSFSGLALLAGILWFLEFRERGLALALAAPCLALVLGNLWLLRQLL